MKTARLKTLARTIIFLLFGLSALAYGARTRMPDLLIYKRHTAQAASARPVFIDGILSVGGFALNVAFAPDGRPVCISVSAEKQG